MKLNNFLTEHSLKISKIDEGFVLVSLDEKEISPRLASNDLVKMWIIKNTSEIFYKLYTEGK